MTISIIVNILVHIFVLQNPFSAQKRNDVVSVGMLLYSKDKVTTATAPHVSGDTIQGYKQDTTHWTSPLWFSPGPGPQQHT